MKNENLLKNYEKAVDEKKSYVVFSLELAKYLIRNGAKLLDVSANTNPEYKGNLVFYFGTGLKTQKILFTMYYNDN